MRTISAQAGVVSAMRPNAAMVAFILFPPFRAIISAILHPASSGAQLTWRQARLATGARGRYRGGNAGG
jgi:hypothetical protein